MNEYNNRGSRKLKSNVARKFRGNKTADTATRGKDISIESEQTDSGERNSDIGENRTTGNTSESVSGPDNGRATGRRGRRGRRRTDTDRDNDHARTGTGVETGIGNGDRDETDSRKTANILGEIPVRNGVKRRGRKTKTTETEKAALIGMLSVGCSALYSTIGLFAGQHWNLDETESLVLASSLDNALNTLDQEYYGIIKSTIEKYIPWVSLIITAGLITYPRIQTTLSPENPVTHFDQTTNSGRTDYTDDERAIFNSDIPEFKG